VQTSGLRASCLWGYWLQLACVSLSYAACSVPLSAALGLQLHASYDLLFLAQVLGAFSSPFYFNCITLLTADWFAPSERDAAVALCLVLAGLGSVFIGTYAPLAVRSAHDVARLFAWQIPAWLAVCLAALFCAADQPPAPPSAAAAVQRQRARQRRAAPRGSAADALSVAAEHTRELIRNANFNALNWSTAVLQGVVTLLSTVVGQMDAPCGLAPAAAGESLSALAACSVLAVLAYVWAIRRGGAARRPYVWHQWAWSLSTAAAVAFVLAALRPTAGRGATVLAWAALGLGSGVVSNGALAYEHAADMSWPTPANVSLALLGVTSAIVAYGMVMVSTPMLAGAACGGLWHPFPMFVLSSTGVGVALLLPLQESYKRSDVEARIRAGGGTVDPGYGALL